MHCLFGCLAFLAPRLTLIGLQLFTGARWSLESGYVTRAYATLLWPVLGLVFMPLTTLAYAWAKNSHGTVEGYRLVILVLAVLIDLGIIGKGGRGLRRKKDE